LLIGPLSAAGTLAPELGRMLSGPEVAIHRRLAACRAAKQRSHSSGVAPASESRPIDNRPQATSLPHNAQNRRGARRNKNVVVQSHDGAPTKERTQRRESNQRTRCRRSRCQRALLSSRRISYVCLPEN
jgi:hypothetical protein